MDSKLDFAMALAQVFNAAGPAVANLIVMIRRKDGTVSVVTMLDEADEQFQSNLEQARDWMTQHPDQP